MSFWYDVNNKKYAENDKQNWTTVYCEKLVDDLRKEQTADLNDHISGERNRHDASQIDTKDDKNLQQHIDSVESRCDSLESTVADKVDKVSGKGLSANDYTDADKTEVAKVKDKVDKISGKGLSANDYTDTDKNEVAKVKNKVDKVSGKGLSSNDYTSAEKADVATIPNKVDKEAGKGLSTNDFSNTYKAKLDGLDSNLNSKADKSDVIGKTNTEEYTPTANFHPATKKYVDDLASSKGGGDMMKTVYDQNADGVVDDSDKLGGLPPESYVKAEEGKSLISDDVSVGLTSTTKSVIFGSGTHKELCVGSDGTSNISPKINFRSIPEAGPPVISSIEQAETPTGCAGLMVKSYFAGSGCTATVGMDALNGIVLLNDYDQSYDDGDGLDITLKRNGKSHKLSQKIDAEEGKGLVDKNLDKCIGAISYDETSKTGSVQFKDRVLVHDGTMPEYGSIPLCTDISKNSVTIYGNYGRNVNITPEGGVRVQMATGNPWDPPEADVSLTRYVFSPDDPDQENPIEETHKLSLKANASEVLSKKNTEAYTPKSDYHPATKKYVDDIANNISVAQWLDGEFIGTGKFENLSTATSYRVVIPSGVSIIKVTYGQHRQGWAGKLNNLTVLRKNSSVIGYAGDFYDRYGDRCYYNGNSLNTQLVSVTAGDVLELHATDVEDTALRAQTAALMDQNVNSMPAEAAKCCLMMIELIK